MPTDFAMSISVLAYRNDVVTVMIVENANIIKTVENDTNDINGNNELNVRNKFSLFLHPENNASGFAPLKILGLP